MRAHFFDLDTILQVSGMVWIVDKNKPNIPIFKISKSDFNLIRSGIYRNQNNLINFGDDKYWIPTNLYNQLKIKTKNYKADFSNLGFSLQEFMNKEIIENLDYSLILEHILHLKNTDDHIYIICSKNSKKNYEIIIKKIESLLEENGLKVNNFYFISETFFNRDHDDICYKKVRLLLQHLLGYKTKDDIFSDEQVEQYDEVYFYDDDHQVINLSKQINQLLFKILSKTDQTLKEEIKNMIKQKELTLIINFITNNKVNRFITDKVILHNDNLIKTFESFKFNF